MNVFESHRFIFCEKFSDVELFIRKELFFLRWFCGSTKPFSHSTTVVLNNVKTSRKSEFEQRKVLIRTPSREKKRISFERRKMKKEEEIESLSFISFRRAERERKNFELCSTRRFEEKKNSVQCATETVFHVPNIFSSWRFSFSGFSDFPRSAERFSFFFKPKRSNSSNFFNSNNFRWTRSKFYLWLWSFWVRQFSSSVFSASRLRSVVLGFF